MTPEQLGLDQKDPKELRIPAGLEEVGDWWFEDSALEHVGYRAFARTRLAQSNWLSSRAGGEEARGCRGRLGGRELGVNSFGVC